MTRADRRESGRKQKLTSPNERDRVWSDQEVEVGVIAVRSGQGDDPDVRFTDLRCTATTRLGQAGCSTDMIRAVTGHASLQVVARCVRPDDTMARAAMERLTQNRLSTATENSSRGPTETTEKI